MYTFTGRRVPRVSRVPRVLGLVPTVSRGAARQARVGSKPAPVPFALWVPV